MIKLFHSSWAACLVGTLLYLGTTVAVWKPPIADTTANSEETGAPSSAASWDFHNPEVDLLIAELKQEKESLAKREAQLKELAERLQTERLEINQVTQAVHQMQLQFDSDIVRVTKEEALNVKKLARTYATMTPEGAAAILKQLDETTLVKILATMKESETAPILEAMGQKGEAESKRVAALSERLRLSLPNPPSVKRPSQ